MLRGTAGLLPNSVLAVVALAGSAPSAAPQTPFRHGLSGDAKPWTHERFAESDGFTFAIFSDLNGGERPGVFEVAVAQLGLLRPELVLSVGDLIDGVGVIEAPVFYVGGNHDLTSERLRAVWAKRYGPLYYSFVYKNVLFLILDSEDYDADRRREIHEARQAAIEVMDGGEPERARKMEYYRMPERLSGRIGDEQSRYLQQVLAENPDVRWTFLFAHKPVWLSDDAPGLAALEQALADRPYTFFSGHFHSYSHAVRNGRDYVMLGTTGGGQSSADPMAFDHLTLVTVSGDEPAIASLKLEGILDETGHVPAGGEELCFQASRCGSE
jgi:Calcineurin-like phosphoesterase